MVKRTTNKLQLFMFLLLFHSHYKLRCTDIVNSVRLAYPILLFPPFPFDPVTHLPPLIPLDKPTQLINNRPKSVEVELLSVIYSI